MSEGPVEAPFARAMRTCVLGARVGFSVALSALAAEVSLGFAPASLRAVAYAACGATVALLCWRITGRMFGRPERIL